MVEIDGPLIGSALGTGIAFGFVLQRGGVCLTRAISNAALAGDTAILRAYMLALLVAMAGVQVILSFELAEIPVRQLRWVSNVVGGALFGVGMILSGGCSGSTWYRVGEGAVGAWVILLGFAIGATTVAVGGLDPLRRALQRPVITTGPGAAPTLANVTGLSPWIVIAILAAAAGLWMWWARSEAGGHTKWPWSLTGAAVGVMIAVGWWASTYGDRPVGITFAANTGHLLTYPMVGYPTKATWSMWMALGVPVGAFVSAKRAGEFGWKVPPGDSLVKIFGGGLLMGGAALIAEGCNINQGLTNAATLALGSLLTFAAMGAGAWVTLWALYMRR
jgi:hypothetical protein